MMTRIPLFALTILSMASMNLAGTAFAQGPPAHNPGQPFAELQTLIEEVKTQLDEARAEILSELGALGDDVASLQSDVSDLQVAVAGLQDGNDDIQDDIQVLGAKIDGITPPLTQFKVFQVGVNEDETTTTTISSTGPMLVDVCNSVDSGVTLIQFEPNSSFQDDVDEDSNCRTVGVNTGTTLKLVSNPSFHEDSTWVFVSIRTTQSATLDINQSTVPID